ncbi:MAG TPA: hypothetical protein VG838_06845 [Opitutaceae bacterium]|nr:hypothetical protein [Lacunisphaera sp.]HWA09148.1 hypothetical protein [Opitutaceae bacterium]
MKTLTKFLLVAALGGSFSASAIAGPGPQFWNRSASSPAVKVAAPANDGSVLACEHMLVRNTGPGSDRVPWVSVSCSVELLRTNEACRSQCGVATPAKPEPTKLTCAHMLMHTTGPGSSRVALKSVNCTPEMMASNPECQSACRS